MELSKNSWQYKYIRSELHKNQDQINICTLVRIFVLKTVWFTVGFFVFVSLGLFLISPITLVYFGWFSDHSIFENLTKSSPTVEYFIFDFSRMTLMLESIVFVGMSTWLGIKKLVSKIPQSKKPTLISLWQRSIKEKTCFIIKLKD